MEKITPEVKVGGHLQGFTLQCPSCDNTWLHQESVEVFVRGDSNEYGTHINADYSDEVTIGSDVTVEDGNPSARRSGIKISFWCELCDGLDGKEDTSDAILIISQHKGQEQMYWEGEEDE